ncbi:MAG: GNAT family N-acetyltransferase [Promethearchaeota archaeon]
MVNYKNLMKIEKALKYDLKEILKLQKLAYLSEAEIYNDYSIPPLTQTLDEIKEDFSFQLFLKSVIKSKIIGSVRAYKGDDTCYIGKLIVYPNFQNKGIGTKLLKEIETKFDNVKRYELFTGYKSERNLYLYQKLGYHQFRSEKINENLQLIYLEKNK